MLLHLHILKKEDWIPKYTNKKVIPAVLQIFSTVTKKRKKITITRVYPCSVFIWNRNTENLTN